MSRPPIHLDVADFEVRSQPEALPDRWTGTVENMRRVSVAFAIILALVLALALGATS